MAKEIGKVTHYYDKAGVAVVELASPLKVGDTLTFKRGGESFSQAAGSIQIEHENVEGATAGASVGLKVDQKVKPGTKVLRD